MAEKAKAEVMCKLLHGIYAEKKKKVRSKRCASKDVKIRFK
jgi:hypothetical protein